ncbi:MAG: aspartyl protease family protein [Candidatus Eisenbacteria bacterium]|uniref:Aspartyl protease family protein n=1 Tax=Eiseniibacteriota bacterium TaxID=2212470 RepID=A0A933SB78_UNCEI|nr:aspartyl protease family protein [Candidatus Eisenbacteria bacterium]
MHKVVHRAVCVAAIAMTACVDAVHAEISEPARAIVQKYVEASGGAAAFGPDSVLHLKCKLSTGGERGRWEAWVNGAEQMLLVEAVGPVQMRVGLDRGVAWRTDLQARNVSPLEGKDLEALQSQAWFLSEQWAREGQGGGKVVMGGTAYSKGRSMVSIVVTPPVGPGRTLWFDAETGLLARVTHRRDQYSWDEHLLDWKTLAGRKRWTTSVLGDSMLFPDHFERMNLDSVSRELPRAVTGFGPPRASVKPVAWLKAKGVAKLPFQYRRGHVWVRASLNGAAPADFILDTGCTMTAVDRNHATDAGIELAGHMSAEGVGGSESGAWGKVRTLRLSSGVGPKADGVVVSDLTVAALGLNDTVEKLEWDDTAGLIGYDVLSRFVVEFDFDKQVVTLSDPAGWKHEGPGAAVPFVLHRGIPTVEVQLNESCRGRFIVDVGNATVMQVNSHQVDDCKLFGTRRTKEVRHWVGGIGGAFPETVCRLDSLRIGPFGWNEPVAGLTLHRYGGAGSLEIQGNIGTSVLERFKCTFDYARGTLWLEPGARYTQRDRFSRSGLWFVRWQGVVYVAAVVRHSPGADAGLKVRDILKAVNGKPVDRWTPEALEQLFENGEPGTVVKVTVERELVDQVIEVTLADVM